MVSLGNDGRRQGGYFFDQEQSVNYQSSDEFLTSDRSTLTADVEPKFKPLKTTWTAVLSGLLSIGFITVTFVLPDIFCKNVKDCHISAFSYLVYLHAVIWFITFLLDRYLCHQHTSSRNNGYLEFYRRTRNIKRAPLLVYSGGNAIMLVVLTVLRDFCNHDKPCTEGSLKRVNYLQILIAIESVLVLPCLVLYLVRTVKFNKRGSPPDVQEDDVMSSFLQSQQTTEIGFRDETFLEEVLEKQADMIRYLKQHNASLGRKILKLTTQLNTRGGL